MAFLPTAAFRIYRRARIVGAHRDRLANQLSCGTDGGASRWYW